MALIQLRAMFDHCKCCHQFVKHTKTFCTTKFSSGKTDLFARRTRMLTPQHFSAAYLSRNSFGRQLTRHDSFLSYILQKNFSICCVLHKNIVADEIVTSSISDIDLEKLKEQIIKERKETQETVHLIARVKEVISKKCDELLANLAPEDERKLKVIKLEHSFLLSEGYQIPSEEQMTSQNWIEALKLPSKLQRLKYYLYLAKRSYVKEAARSKRAAPKEEKERVPSYEHGRIFIRIYETTMKRWLNYRLATSMQFGIPLVIDMDYNSIMRSREIRNTAAQIHDIYTLNRADTEMPFHLHFTSCSQDNSIYRLFQLQLQEDQNHLATVSEKSYLDLFDKRSLVYLSPNGRQVMTEFNPNAVYIIGAFNDKAVQQPISYARAKEQGIKCQRLPLDEYMKWGLGSKSLTLDQIIKIMLSLKNEKSWSEAFNAIPRRKLQNSEDSDSLKRNGEDSDSLKRNRNKLFSLKLDK